MFESVWYTYAFWKMYCLNDWKGCTSHKYLLLKQDCSRTEIYNRLGTSKIQSSMNPLSLFFSLWHWLYMCKNPYFVGNVSTARLMQLCLILQIHFRLLWQQNWSSCCSVPMFFRNISRDHKLILLSPPFVLQLHDPGPSAKHRGRVWTGFIDSMNKKEVDWSLYSSSVTPCILRSKLNFEARWCSMRCSLWCFPTCSSARLTV